jgi:hypothetical protein
MDIKENEMIDKSDFTPDRLAALAEIVVDRWDLETLMDFAVSSLYADYEGDLDRAVTDAHDCNLTVEQLDNQE